MVTYPSRDIETGNRRINRGRKRDAGITGIPSHHSRARSRNGCCYEQSAPAKLVYSEGNAVIEGARIHRNRWPPSTPDNLLRKNFFRPIFPAQTSVPDGFVSLRAAGPLGPLLDHPLQSPPRRPELARNNADDSSSHGGVVRDRVECGSGRNTGCHSR